MDSQWCDIIRSHSEPLEPLPTGASPVIRPLRQIRAVLFDIYGTLIVSGSGEIGSMAGCRETALRDALESVGLKLSVTRRFLSSSKEPESKGSLAELWNDAVARSHDHSRQEGVPFPEVDVRAVWADVLRNLDAAGALESKDESVDLARLAIEHETRLNPTWPMPGLEECLGALRRRGLALGIISNAQLYTPVLFDAFLGRSVNACGFADDLVIYSYQAGHAKPGPQLFADAVEAVSRRGIAPSNVLFVGNDLLNDVAGGSRAGFRTALFAGDRRSLRWRRGDPRVEGIQPDLVITELEQIAGCLAGS